MIITKPGKVTDRILLLGVKESSVYILKGEDEYAKEARAILEASYIRIKDVKKSTEEMTNMLMENAPEDFLH